MLHVDTIAVHCAAKRGQTKNDFEDAFTPLPQRIENTVTLAIADGATESSFSKEWAKILTHQYKRFGIDKTWYEQCIRLWSERVTKNTELDWFAEKKLEDGAHAAFLGVDIDLVQEQLRTEAIGDCNLYVVRNKQIVYAFPCTQVAEFTNNPILCSTKGGEALNYKKEDRISLQSQDTIILASDALAAAILQYPYIIHFFDQLIDPKQRVQEKEEIEKHIAVLKKKSRLTHKEHLFDLFVSLVFPQKKADEAWSFQNFIFINWVEYLRNNKQLKNDDTTLYIITLK